MEVAEHGKAEAWHALLALESHTVDPTGSHHIAPGAGAAQVQKCLLDNLLVDTMQAGIWWTVC